MAVQRVALTELTNRTPLRLGARGVHEDQGRATALLASLAGTDAAGLFTSATITLGNGAAPGSAEWTTEFNGEVTPFLALAPPAREEAEGRLRDILSRLLPLFSHPELGAWLRRAMVVPGPSSVFTVGGQPVLVDWGLASPGVTESPAGLERAMRAGLAAFLPSDAAAPPTVVPAPSQVASGAAAGMAAAGPVMQPRRFGTTPTPAIGARWVLPAGLVIAALFLALGLWIGAQMIRGQIGAQRAVASVVTDEAGLRSAIALQRQQNDALEQRIADVRAGMSGNMCVADPATQPRLGVDRAAPVQAAAIPPVASGQPRFEGRLADLMDQAVVLVIVHSEQSTATGTGFFITPELIVTNKHVVESGGSVVVANKALGRAIPAQVLVTTPDSEFGNPDFAVLKVPAQSIQPIGLTTTVARLDVVVAAGFPALVSQIDPIYRAIVDGDSSALSRLQVILSDGKIQAIQALASGLQVLPHSAQISPGSSGGPLVDACGRVVGVNTFGRSADQMPVTVNYAQKANNLLDFLHANNLAVTELTGPCTPASAPPPPNPVTPTPANVSTPPSAAPAAPPPPGSAPAAPAAPHAAPAP